jgi:hypothetical protein
VDRKISSHKQKPQVKHTDLKAQTWASWQPDELHMYVCSLSLVRRRDTELVQMKQKGQWQQELGWTQENRIGTKWRSETYLQEREATSGLEPGVGAKRDEFTARLRLFTPTFQDHCATVHFSSLTSLDVLTSLILLQVWTFCRIKKQWECKNRIMAYSNGTYINTGVMFYIRFQISARTVAILI